jgi:hypothetical protein
MFQPARVRAALGQQIAGSIPEIILLLRSFAFGWGGAIVRRVRVGKVGGESGGERDCLFLVCVSCPLGTGLDVLTCKALRYYTTMTVVGSGYCFVVNKGLSKS